MVDIYVGPDNQHWVLHEKLLCHRSSFFRAIFYAPTSPHRNTAFGLPDEDEPPFRLFVGWLYSDSLPPVRAEADLAPLFDLYLMAEKWAIRDLLAAVLDAVRRFYRDTDSYPGLRRVQYVYANTPPGSPMRKLLVGAVARHLVLARVGLPAHWDKALRRNADLAVDVIVAVQGWGLEAEGVPDPRTDEPVVDGVLETDEVTEEKLVDGINGVRIVQDELPNGVSHDEDEEE